MFPVQFCVDPYRLHHIDLHTPTCIPEIGPTRNELLRKYAQRTSSNSASTLGYSYLFGAAEVFTMVCTDLKRQTDVLTTDLQSDYQ